MGIRENLLHIKEEIARLSEDVVLVAVSKFHTLESVMEAISAGQRIFGENRVQEAIKKWSDIKQEYSDINLHLIGPLQTNKVAEAVSIFDMIEVVDREKLVDVLVKEMQKQGRNIPCLVQVNIGKEPQKSGVMPEELDSLLKYCNKSGLNIEGLMCIPPAGKDPAPYFTAMSRLQQKYGFKILSMGMSGDFSEAIKNGATHVRVGSAIFGDRKV